MKRLASVAVFATVMLSACGFQLRGADGKGIIPFKTIYLNVSENSPLGVELRRNILARDAKIVTDPKAAEAIVDVLSESRDKSIPILNAQGRIRVYPLIYRLRFRVTGSGGKELIAPTEITLKRDISFNESQAIAKEKEEDMLYRDMQSDSVQQILRRLAALNSV